MSLDDEDRGIKAILSTTLSEVLEWSRLPFFHNLFPGRKKEVEWITKYIDDYGNLPKPPQFKRQYPAAWSATSRPEPLSHALGELKEQFLSACRSSAFERLNKVFNDDPNNTAVQVEALQKEADLLRLLNLPPGGSLVKVVERVQQLKADLQSNSSAALKQIPLGMVPLDRELGGGAMAGMLIVLAALINLGKTYTMIAWAESARKAGFRPLIVPLEMTKEQILDRCLAVRFGLNADWYVKKEMPVGETRSREEWLTALLIEADKLIAADPCKGEVFVEEPTGPCTPAFLRSVVRQHEADILFIDAAQDMWDNAKTKDRVGRTYNSIAELNLLAKELRIPICMTVQFQAEVEKQGKTKGNLASIQWAQVFAQKAQVVIGMTGDRSTGIRQVTTEKNRDGGVGREWQISMEFPNVKIIGEDLKPIGITINPEDIQDDAEHIARLFQDPDEDPVPASQPTTVPQTSIPKRSAPTDSEASNDQDYPVTDYQARQQEKADKRSLKRMKRLDKRHG